MSKYVSHLNLSEKGSTIAACPSFSVSSLCVIVLESFYKFPNQNFKAVSLNLPSQKNVSGKKCSNIAANVTSEKFKTNYFLCFAVSNVTFEV